MAEITGIPPQSRHSLVYFCARYGEEFQEVSVAQNRDLRCVTVSFPLSPTPFLAPYCFSSFADPTTAHSSNSLGTEWLAVIVAFRHLLLKSSFIDNKNPARYLRDPQLFDWVIAGDGGETK